MATELYKVFALPSDLPQNVPIYWDTEAGEYYNKSTDIYLSDDDIAFYKLPKVGNDIIIIYNKKLYGVKATADVLTMIYYIVNFAANIKGVLPKLHPHTFYQIPLIRYLTELREYRYNISTCQAVFNLDGLL